MHLRLSWQGRSGFSNARAASGPRTVFRQEGGWESTPPRQTVGSNRTEMSGDPYKETGQTSDKRRSQRVLLQIPILVRAQFEGDTPLTEETNTLVVNADGALISLAMRVKPGQKLVLRNWSTAKEQTCRVVHVREKPIGKNEIGIAFPAPMPQFWGLAFPPPDWTSFPSKGH